MNIVLPLLAIIVGGAGSLVGFKKVPMDKFMDPSEAEDWHRKWGMIFKIIGPIAVVAGLYFLIFK
jgi:hypothetical protein